jgi:hypothetical protein
MFTWGSGRDAPMRYIYRVAALPSFLALRSILAVVSPPSRRMTQCDNASRDFPVSAGRSRAHESQEPSKFNALVGWLGLAGEIAHNWESRPHVPYAASQTDRQKSGRFISAHCLGYFASTGTCERRIAREVPWYIQSTCHLPQSPAVWIGSPPCASEIRLSP